MKLLRNPMAVGVLVVLAVGVIAYQFWPMLRPRFARSSPPPPTPPTTTTPAATPREPAKPVPSAAGTNALSQVSTASLDIVVLEVNSARWAEAPRNDPFKVRYYVGPQSTNSRPARELMTLNAIWQQANDSALAVINNHVFNEGDVIVVLDGKVMLEYTVSDIESDRVWVDGPNGREPLRFRLPASSGDTATAEFTLEKEVRVTPKSGP